MAFDSHDVERKVISILKILSDSREPLGARVIANHLKEYGVELGERAVRYHLKLMDERGLTRLIGRRDGRVLTEQGAEEVKSALVKDKVGLAISRIELLAYRTTFECEKYGGLVPVNVSFFPSGEFNNALEVMKPAFDEGLCVSELVAVAREGKMLGGLTVPEGKVGLATVCSIVVNGTLLKVGIPMVSTFSGILQIKNHKPLRFVELIYYSGCTLDPSDVFIKARMTSVGEVAKSGSGQILATYREIPALCRPKVVEEVAKLKNFGLEGVLVMGNPSEPVCEIPVEPNRVGIVLLNGLNPVAAAVEAGIEVENRGMSTVMEYRDLVSFKEI